MPCGGEGDKEAMSTDESTPSERRQPSDPARKTWLPYRCRVKSCGIDCPVCGSPGVYPGAYLPISEPKAIDED